MTAAWRLLLLVAPPLAEAARLAHTEVIGRKALDTAQETATMGPPLCAAGIVEDTCKLLSGGASDVSLAEVSKFLAADQSSVTECWTDLGLLEEERVSCMELCAAVVSFIGERWQLPPSSDVACYQEKGVTKCDLDLSPPTLRSLIPKGEELPDLHDDVPLPAQGLPEGSTSGREGQLFAVPKTVDYSIHALLVRQANLFRIYPTPATDVVTAKPGSLLEEEDEELLDVSGSCQSWCSDFPSHCKFSNSCGGCAQCNGAPVQTLSAGACTEVCSRLPDPCKFSYTCSGCPKCQSNSVKGTLGGQSGGSAVATTSTTSTASTVRTTATTRSTSATTRSTSTTTRSTSTTTRSTSTTTQSTSTTTRSTSTTTRSTSTTTRSTSTTTQSTSTAATTMRSKKWKTRKTTSTTSSTSSTTSSTSSTTRSTSTTTLSTSTTSSTTSSTTTPTTTTTSTTSSTTSSTSTTPSSASAATAWKPPPARQAPGERTAPGAEWKTEVQKRNVQAQAYVNLAMLKLQSKQAQAMTAKWFGASAPSDPHVQAELLRVLNSVAAMMGNVEYVFPGPKCEPKTYAYVYARGKQAKDGNGKFVFYLCQLYMDAEVAVQIETLTHEGSHHATAYTNDICMDEFKEGGQKARYLEVPITRFATAKVDDKYDWPMVDGGTVPAVVRLIRGSMVVLQLEPEKNCKSKAYGRNTCADLAKKDAVKALRNADNMCYWIQDVAEQQ